MRKKMWVVAVLMGLAGKALGAPIHPAVWDGDSAQVREILAADPAQINSWDDIQGRTPLHIAAQRDNVVMARLLLAAGADPSAAGVKSGDLSYTGIGVTPLHIAAGRGNGEMAKLLLDHGAEVNAASLPLWRRMEGEGQKDENALYELSAAVMAAGKTPLHFAAIRGHLAVGRLLLERGAKVDALDEKGQTPVHLAAYHGRQEMLAWLVEQGASLTARSADGWGLIHYAAANGTAETLSFLLAHGAGANEPGGAYEGRPAWKITPLHLAALRGNVEVVALLLREGANPGAAAASGLTPLEAARKGGKAEIISALERAAAGGGGPSSGTGRGKSF